MNYLLYVNVCLCISLKRGLLLLLFLRIFPFISFSSALMEDLGFVSFSFSPLSSPVVYHICWPLKGCNLVFKYCDVPPMWLVPPVLRTLPVISLRIPIKSSSFCVPSTLQFSLLKLFLLKFLSTGQWLDRPFQCPKAHCSWRLLVLWLHWLQVSRVSFCSRLFYSTLLDDFSSFLAFFFWGISVNSDWYLLSASFCCGHKWKLLTSCWHILVVKKLLLKLKPTGSWTPHSPLLTPPPPNGMGERTGGGNT